MSGRGKKRKNVRIKKERAVGLLTELAELQESKSGFRKTLNCWEKRTEEKRAWLKRNQWKQHSGEKVKFLVE